MDQMCADSSSQESSQSSESTSSAPLAVNTKAAKSGPTRDDRERQKRRRERLRKLSDTRNEMSVSDEERVKSYQILMDDLLKDSNTKGYLKKTIDALTRARALKK